MHVRKSTTPMSFRLNHPLMLVLLVAAAGNFGCASNTPVVERDPVDSLIAANAAQVTQALRELSEATGGSRVVTTATTTPKPASASPMRRTQEPVAQPHATVPQSPAAVSAPGEQQAALAPTPQPSRLATIGSRSGAIAVDAPQGQVVDAPSTGVVTSGGLLSAPPAGLERLITVRWTGDLEQLISRVCQEVGWTYVEATGLRVAPVIISISAENRSAFDVLRDIGAIAGAAAEIRVSSDARTVTVRYPKR